MKGGRKGWWALLPLVLLACSHTVKQQGLESCEPDCPEDWPSPDAAGGGGGKLPIHLRDGGTQDSSDAAEPDSAPPHRIGDLCYLEHSPGTVCLLRPDASFTEMGCSRLPGRCEPFEDAGS